MAAFPPPPTPTPEQQPYHHPEPGFVDSMARLTTTTDDPTTRDLISIQNLQLPHGILAPDVWGNSKEQPCLLTLNLLFQKTFACHEDRLDDSTIHYGALAKEIRKRSTQGQTAEGVSQHVERAIRLLGAKEGRGFVVARSTVEVKLPKASMFSERGVSLLSTTGYDLEGKVVEFSRVFRVEGIKIMTLIGVNGYERSQKQPLVVSVALNLRGDAEETGQTAALFNFEALVVQVIQETSFETLEMLADFTISQLRKKMLDAVLPGARVQLRIEKPRAIAFADAPAVEIIRDVPSSEDQAKRATRVDSSAPGKARARPPSGERSTTPAVDSRASSRLSVIKPYNV
ncbi:hypothetical protein AC578_5716 [Lecanosticta acicola]|uniref:dihydroneopterin aldolase n=1 Tax=Lecanosticta acicola TaxID=111012 RepID=A0AAI9EBD3_9PEZI|nr:hypothetical protein AC578_5716 [Lecanosticta acicola]